MARIGLLVLLVVISALPARAGGAAADAGISQGIASYGKQPGDCDHHGGSTSPSGGGMGIMGLAGPKDLGMRYEGEAFSASRGQAGSMSFCMRLTSVLGNVVPVGGGCDVSKAYGGQGKLVWPDSGETVWLSRLGWKLGASPGQVPGHYAVMTGQARTDHGGAYPKAKDKGTVDSPSSIVALVTLGLGPGCLKSAEKGSFAGWTQGVAFLEYAIVPGVDVVGLIGEPPPLCKQPGSPVNVPSPDGPIPGHPGHGCLYSEKP